MSESAQFDVENTRAQLRKGIVECCILLVIAEGEIYASDILKELQKRDLMVVGGTVYPLLNRLKRAGLLDYTWRESLAGPPRKYYVLTKDGHAAITRLADTWKPFAKSISSLPTAYEKGH